MELLLVLRLCAAVILGGVLGLQRSVAGKHAGMRTYALVSLGSSLFCVVGTLASFQLSMFAGLNPLMIASNVVLGVGFIGAGLAAFSGKQPVELTTASGIWVAAGIGMACGFGLYILATTTMLLGVFILQILSSVERTIRIRFGTGHEE